MADFRPLNNMHEKKYITIALSRNTYDETSLNHCKNRFQARYAGQRCSILQEYPRKTQFSVSKNATSLTESHLKLTKLTYLLPSLPCHHLLHGRPPYFRVRIPKYKLSAPNIQKKHASYCEIPYGQSR